MHRTLHRPACGAFALALLAGCADPMIAGAPDGNLVVAASISGRVSQPRAVFVHPRDGRHDCFPPTPAQLAMARGATPPSGAAADRAFSYAVAFGPDFPGGTGLSEEWIPYGPQSRFALELFFAADDPARLRRTLRITVSAGGWLWARTIDADDPAPDDRVAIAPDGRSGRFRVRGLEQQIPHNRMPPEVAIAIEGEWRCPAG